MNSVTSATKHLRSITDTHLLVYMRRSLRARRPPPSPKGRLTGYSDHHPSLPSSTGSTTTDGTSGSSGHWYVDAARALAETKSDVYGDIVAFNNAHPEEYVCRLHTAATFAVLNPPDCTDSRLTSLVHVHAIEALTRMCPISVCVVLPFKDKQTNMRSTHLIAPHLSPKSVSPPTKITASGCRRGLDTIPLFSFLKLSDVARCV
jgi:hypothetical protein